MARTGNAMGLERKKEHRLQTAEWVLFGGNGGDHLKESNVYSSMCAQAFCGGARRKKRSCCSISCGVC